MGATLAGRGPRATDGGISVDMWMENGLFHIYPQAAGTITSMTYEDVMVGVFGKPGE